MMDLKTPNCCPNCCQLYYVNLLSSKAKGNLPLFLSCGHSMCENCLKNIVKFMEPIECKVCHKDMVVDALNVALLNQKKLELYQIFPVNYHMLGELTLGLLRETELKKHSSNYDKKEKDCYINISSILIGNENKKDCMECHQKTMKMCQQCSMFLCDGCFTKSHKNFVIFKNHMLQDIGQLVPISNCTIHKDKPMDYYCKDCKKSVCMDCFMVGGEKSCKAHNVISMQEINSSFLEEINTIAPNVDETFKRLTKTAVDIGNLLYNVENETGPMSELTQIILDIEQHFSKLCSIVQKHKQEVIDIVVKLKQTEKQSLHNARDQVTASLKKTKLVMDTLKMTSDAKKLKEINLSVLLDDAKKIIESPWYLKCDENVNNPLKVAVNEDLCTLISDYIHLEGNGKSAYKLHSTAELGDIEIPPPPPTIVYPPELPKDVRQIKNKDKPTPKEEAASAPSFFKSAPKYRNKSNSVTSLNSCSSDSSQQSYLQSEGYNKRPALQVKPFLESQKPDKLQEGCQELIYISHIVDPHNFYVQRACHQSLVKEMLRQFRNAVSLPKPSINHVVEGKAYLAYNHADSMWQRCRIVTIERKQTDCLFHVFFYDFGSTEIVKIDKLRLLPPGHVQPAPLAINCALANCKPVAGAWTTEDAILIQNIIDNKQAVIFVREVNKTSSSEEQLVCDVTTFEDGVSVAHALVFHERAKMPNSRLKYPKSIGVKDRPKIFMGNDDYKPKSVEEVCITHIVNPDKFYVRKRHQQVTFEKLTLELEQEYSFGPTGNVYLPEIGMCVSVRMDAVEPGRGGTWARGVVLELPGRARALVHAVDCGAELLVHWTRLRPLRPRHAALSALATECHLAGVTPLNKRWKPASVALLQNYTDKFLELHVEENRHRGSIGVIIYDRTGDEEVCLNEEMIKHKFAVCFGIFTFQRPVEGPVITQKSPFNNPPPRQKKANQIQILKKNETSEMKKSDLQAKDKGPFRLEAKVLQYQSPSLIYVSLAHQQKVFNELFENMQVYYSKEKAIEKTDWKVGDPCCNLSSQSQTWRRAVIVEIKDSDAKVFYSDFAYVETVPLKGLRELPTEFASIGEAAVKCHLQGVIPAVGEEWPSITKEFLKELIDSYNRVFITKVGNFKNKSMPVEIWVYHTTQGSALEPNTSEWRCLNQRIVEQGLAIPDKAFQAVKPEKTVAEGEEEMLSFLNVKGPVCDWLQLEPMPTKPLISSPNAGNRSGTSTPKGSEEFDDQNDPSVMFISDWLPPEPLASNEFTAMPTYIDNDGVIYLHDVSKQEVLDLIRKALDVRFRQDDPKAKYVKWTVGEPCIALYYLDNRYYRGRVLEVNNEEAKCTVHYIDYGNEEQCSFVNMRKSIALHQITTQAHKCMLNRIRPIGAQWDRLTLDYVHKSVVEKKCTVKVVGEAINGVLPIELSYDKLCINDHLVDFEMAMYTDGTKAVVRKYAPTTEAGKKIEKQSVVMSDSEPDYIFEDDENKSSSHDDSFETPLKGISWNKMMEDDDTGDDSNSPNDNFKTYPKFSDELFKCNITVINDYKTLELNIVHDDEIALVYEELSRDLQIEAESMPLLKGVFENKACVALFKEDNQWYRASIMEYSEAKRKVKVKYVDYGNIDIVSLDNVREIHDDWVNLTPASVTAQLHGINVNPDIDINILTQEYMDTFLDKGPFDAQVIINDPLSVVLKNEKNELVYQNLIEKGVFVKCDDS